MARRKSYPKYNYGANTRMKHPEYLTTDYYHTSASHTDLMQIRRTLAKAANQRLVRLERASSPVTGESYASYGAAQIAYNYLEARGLNRFSENKNYALNYNDIRYEISALQSFLTAKSSTVKGQREIERKRQKTFESGQYGSTPHEGLKHASNKDFYNFLNSDLFKNYSKIFDSSKIIEIYDQYREDDDDSKVLAELESLYEKYEAGARISLQSLTEGMTKLK